MKFSQQKEIKSIFHRPNLEENTNLIKKFIRRKHEIFQSIGMKKAKIEPEKLESQKDNSLLSFIDYDQIAQPKFQLPNIYLYSKPKHKQLIEIQDVNRIVSQISKNLNFINKKISIMKEGLLESIKQTTKSIPYQSDEYRKQLKVLNSIFSHCDMSLKARDILLMQGEKSKTKYSVFTNHPKHPQTLCCSSQVLIKHIEFVSPKHFKFTKQIGMQKPLRSLLLISCIKCGQDIIKIRPSEEDFQPQLNEFQQKRRLLSLSKLVSSGRFKKFLINDQSVELVKSRNLTSLDRSNTSLSKIQQTSIVMEKKLKQKPRYEIFDRDTRVKSLQTSLDVKSKYRQQQIQEMVRKRKTAKTQMLPRNFCQ